MSESECHVTGASGIKKQEAAKQRKTGGELGQFGCEFTFFFSLQPNINASCLEYTHPPMRVRI